MPWNIIQIIILELISSGKYELMFKFYFSYNI